MDNIQAACQRLEDAGYKFQKKLKDGRMHHIAVSIRKKAPRMMSKLIVLQFALDPDEYWVEIIAQNDVEKTENVKETNIETYRMNHTMLRVSPFSIS